MIYLISQVTSYFWPKFTIIWISSHRHQISFQDFPGTLRSIFVDCFWRTIVWSTQKMHISEYVCKTCIKELGILLTFEKIFAAANSSENTGLPRFFFLKVSWQLYFKNINFLAKIKRCLLWWLLWIQNYNMTGK